MMSKPEIQRLPMDAEQRIQELREQIKTIKMIAKVFGTTCGEPVPVIDKIAIVGDANFRAAALDTIVGLANKALTV